MAVQLEIREALEVDTFEYTHNGEIFSFEMLGDEHFKVLGGRSHESRVAAAIAWCDREIETRNGSLVSLDAYEDACEEALAAA